MSVKRQNPEWDSKISKQGEALEDVEGANEPHMVPANVESLAETEHMMEEILEPENLSKALHRVLKNKGAPGVDGMKIDELEAFLAEAGNTVKQLLLESRYQPKPVRRVEIEKPGGGIRQLGIPCVVDRFIQQAVLQVLQKRWDSTFSNSSFGFRPNRSQHQAVEQAQKYVSSGLSIVVDIDLEKFFDRVNHDILMSKIAKRIRDKRVLKLIRSYLNAGMMEDGVKVSQDDGVPQGGPLSPLLSNLMLDELDKELERRKLSFVRYADDCNIYVRSQRAGERVLSSISNFLAKKLRLKVNEAKSAVGKPSQRKFLGFSFTRGPKIRRRIAPQSIQKFKLRIQELTCRKRGGTLPQIIKELSKYMKGWLNYFGYCETPSVLDKLQQWVRRKLRCIIWKRWRRSSTRFERLRAMGLSILHAREGAGNGSRGPSWRMSLSPPMAAAFPIAYFRSLGLPDLVCHSSA
ncbi:MAG: group II intron reverse transcriptase/maturase [Candidatus Obscuribacterales bacterium]|jgi:RNA-directed DNA polymerase|nr:group II intron reverse transcriptase/maturase [Candidatus Obscuribacterales bacterium]